jgi:hypothetical protein
MNARAEDDKLNLADVMAVADAAGRAEEALAKAMVGGGQGEREQFVYEIGFARGRLSRISDRILGKKDVADAS